MTVKVVLLCQVHREAGHSKGMPKWVTMGRCGWHQWMPPPIRKHQGFHLCVSWPGPRTRATALLKVTHLLGVAGLLLGLGTLSLGLPIEQV